MFNKRKSNYNNPLFRFFVGQHVIQQSQVFTAILHVSQMLKNKAIKPHQILNYLLSRIEMSNAANASKLYAPQICIHSVNQK